MGPLLHSLQKTAHEDNIHHGYLIQDNNIRLQRPAALVIKHFIIYTSNLKQTVNGSRFPASGLAKTLGCPASRSPQHNLQTFLFQKVNHSANNGSLAGSRSAGKDKDSF